MDSASHSERVSQRDSKPLRVVIVKPSKYGEDGHVDRFHWGFMPNSTLAHLSALTPGELGGQPCQVTAIDEYVQTDLWYLGLLRRDAGCRTLLALAGVQSHQFQRALDLAAFARANGVESCVIGGPHPMTCDTTDLQGRGVSFALAEAEVVWPAILDDAAAGELQPVYGREQRWARELEPPVVAPPTRRDLRRYVARLQGIYPARGCPYTCNFCSVIKIAGRQVRAQPVATTLASLRLAKAGGVQFVMFTSDNFNKYAQAEELLHEMITERIELPFMVQCDTQVERQEALVALMARAGCFQIFLGAESFSREALRAAHKFQNHPERYARIAALCRRHGILSHFSNILGFPTDTEATLAEHLATLRELDPDLASFYLLTPIPGTEQYDDFLAQGLITERNLDRFDALSVTWRHPNLTPDTWRRWLFRGYRQLHTAPAVLRRLRRTLGAIGATADYRRSASLIAIAGHSATARWGALQHRHPMGGGIQRRRRDHVRDYLELRRRTFDCEMVPLPRSLALGAEDEALNRMAKLAV